MSEQETKPVTANEDDKKTALHPLTSLRRQVDRLFEDFDNNFKLLPFGRKPFNSDSFWNRELSLSRLPAVDVVDKGTAYELSAELPGMDAQHVEVRVENGLLLIQGEKRDEHEARKQDYYLSERHYGSFQRSFALPSGVDSNAITARFAKGVLTLTLPKTTTDTPATRTISIQAED